MMTMRGRAPGPVSQEYPFTLNTGRAVYHFHTRTKTGRSNALNDRVPHAYVEIHPDDAARLAIGLGDRVEIMSPHGRWEGVAMVVDTVRPGDVFIPFHYGHKDQAANQHTWYARDPVSHQPQLKSSPVAVRRLSFAEPEPWLLARLAELDGRSVEPFAARAFGGTINRPASRGTSVSSDQVAQPAPVIASADRTSQRNQIHNLYSSIDRLYPKFVFRLPTYHNFASR